MFQTISWQSYWLTLALLAVGYYLAIYLLYFRRDFTIWFHRRSADARTPFLDAKGHQGHRPGKQTQTSLFEEEDTPISGQPENDTADDVVYPCMDELTAFFVEAKRRKWAKEELVQALRRLLLKYPSLKNSSYRESLSNVIVTQCEHHCSIHLSAEEVVRVW